MCIEISLKRLVGSAVGHIKGKKVIAIARDVQGRVKNFVGQNFGHEGILFLQLDEMK